MGQGEGGGMAKCPSAGDSAVRQQHLCWSSTNKWAKSREQDLKAMLGRTW